MTEWILLSEYLKHKTAEVLSPELADRLVRKELGERQRQYRYLNINGRPHHDDLNDRFWCKAIINVETSSAVWPAATVFYHHVDLGFETLEIKSEGGVKIFRVEVLVPQQSIELAAQVATIDLFRSGAAGRPSAKDVIRKEAERRIAAREISQETLKAFSASIIDWLAKTHPDAPKLSQNRAETILRDLWRPWNTAKLTAK